MSKTYLGVDIGGTAVKLGLVDENGRVLRRAERSVSFDGYKTPILDTVQAAIHEFLTADAPGLEGIAVSATGQIDSRRGVVAGTCGNFPGWIGVDIKGTLERAFGLPVTVANDANCMLLGEVWAGAAKGYTDVIGVTLGTGVGGGILTGGRLLEGARGLGGELGHFRLHALDGVACTCGAIGCYERYAATTALVRSAQKLACAGAGADFVGTTMRGYTPETTGINDVDFGFIAQLARECPAKVIAEGHIHTPEQAVQALYAGAFALVVGGAITRPAEITARYTAAINNHK